MKKSTKNCIVLYLLLPILLSLFCAKSRLKTPSGKDALFSFEVTADMRGFADPNHQSSKYFQGVCEAIEKVGKGAFMVSPGDIDPPKYVYNTIKKVLGNDYTWYPGVGNHEAETPEDMKWLRDYLGESVPHLTRLGPTNGEETNYSFDFENAHFVMLNQYYDGKLDTGTNGDICDSLYIWLKKDLQLNSKPITFIFGHEPIVSIPDYHNGRHRHQGDNLDAYPENNHRFQELLRKYKITAYICGHTHDFSYAKINDIWQLDAGHCRGLGDIGARSTFLKLWVGKSNCTVDVYRYDIEEGSYILTNTVFLNYD